MLKTVEHSADLCVVGGGLAGLCAAVEAARKGLRVVLMQERPVLGGNASSEIRMWVCGAQGENNRETGIMEEINLESLHRNPYKLYSVWDSILYGKAIAEENLTLLLNCSCCDAQMQDGRILSVTGWQMTTQSWQKVSASFFADCSGDSILAPLTGAEYRVGRECAAEFGEKISVTEADRKTMGMSCLIQARETEEKIDFVAPEWALKLTEEDIRRRTPNLGHPGENFWYLELGGDEDSIADTETVRDKLVALAFGYWDYIKNSGRFHAENWQLDFLGFLPGKRESRRMMGPYLMKQQDVLSGGHFDDIVAYGGWALDDHDPRGFYHYGAANVWGETPAPYGIPYRVLYSVNVPNLFFAGRNVSMTHAAMSSVRVMMTCAIMGQAVGCAAAVAKKYGMMPDGVRAHISELQQMLMRDDCFLPYVKRESGAVTWKGTLSGAPECENLRNGIDRNNPIYEQPENGCTVAVGQPITYAFEKPAFVEAVHLVFDSDLDRKTLPGEWYEQYHSMRANVDRTSPKMCMPKTLAESFDICLETESGSRVIPVCGNIRRMVEIPVGQKVRAVSVVIRATYGGADKAHLFAFDLY